LKKEAKTFARWHARWINARAKGSKFFGSFFQKRTACLPDESGFVNLAGKRTIAGDF
jgi:hypothetical protein